MHALKALYEALRASDSLSGGQKGTSWGDKDTSNACFQIFAVSILILTLVPVSFFGFFFLLRTS